ncbi:MAG: M20 family metallo-hydrolase [Bacteroides sp.]|nr:M20 family metallo-hydrolase [Bacteroides sp.]MCM1420928.1 M20 family metallo-hydrolase [Bacteroides sp.]
MSIDYRTYEATALLKRLIETPSISREEKAAADIIETFLTEKRMEVHRHGNNVWSICSDYDEARPTVLLNAHIDTVKPVSGWTHDPFVAETTEDGRIYGLGSNDDGGSVVSLLQAFLHLCGSGHPRNYNVIFLASCEEEVSGKNGIESVLPLLPEIVLGVVGEPTEMQPATAEKGLMVIDVTAHGKAGHAARDEGDNAIYKVLDDIKWISTYRFPKETALLGPVKTTVTIINAGTQHNVIPDKCTFTIDVRSNECYSNEELFEEISAHLRCEAKARSFRLNSSRISHTHPFVKRCEELGLKPFGSPTLSDQALMRFPSVKIGPGSSTRSHTADEYIKIQEIEEAIRLYIKIFDSLHIE